MFFRTGTSEPAWKPRSFFLSSTTSAGDFGQDAAIDWISLDKLYNFTIAVAAGERNLDEVRAWFAAHAQKP